jgi:hypothetical protein
MSVETPTALLDFKNARVVDFGEVVFYSTPLSELPIMKFIILKKEDAYQAICIDI